MALCFAYQFTVLLPHAGIGWQAHIGGLVGGIVPAGCSGTGGRGQQWLGIRPGGPGCPVGPAGPQTRGVFRQPAG